MKVVGTFHSGALQWRIVHYTRSQEYYHRVNGESSPYLKIKTGEALTKIKTSSKNHMILIQISRIFA